MIQEDLPSLNQFYSRDTILNFVYISDLTDTYNLATDAKANSYQTTQYGSTTNPADVAASSTFSVSFEQSQYWDASIQEYGSPAENELNFPTSSTSNRYMAPILFLAESEVPPSNLSSVDITGSQYVHAALQGNILHCSTWGIVSDV